MLAEIDCRERRIKGDKLLELMLIILVNIILFMRHKGIANKGVRIVGYYSKDRDALSRICPILPCIEGFISHLGLFLGCFGASTSHCVFSEDLRILR